MNRAIVGCCHPLPCAAVLAFVLTGMVGCQSKPAAPAAAPAPAVSPDTWATVDGHAITRDQVEKEFRRLRQGSETLSTEEALVAKLGILEDMILEQLMLTKAGSQGVTVSETDLDTAFNEAKKDIPDAAFQQELARRNLTPADMRDGLRREMLGRKMMEHEVTSKVTVTDQEVTDFFNANRAQFNLPEEAYHLAQIVVTPRPDPQSGNRTGDDAVTPEAAANKVKSLMERLKAGGSFADLARDFSEDPNTAQRGGDLGLVPMSQIQKASPLLRDAALKTTPGSARVVNENGVLTIVFVVSHEPKGQRELSSPGVKEQITAGLRSARQQALRAAYLAALRSDAKVTNYLARKVVENQGRPPAQ